MNKWTDEQLRDGMRAGIRELRYLCTESVMTTNEKERSLWGLSRKWTEHDDIHDAEDYDKLTCLLFDRGRIVELQWALVHGQLSECNGQTVCYAYPLVAAFNQLGELSTCDRPEEYRAAIVMGWYAAHQAADYLEDFQHVEQPECSCQSCQHDEHCSPWSS